MFFFLCCCVCYIVKDSSLRSFKRRMRIIILGIGYWVEHLCCNDIESLMLHLNLLLWLLFSGCCLVLEFVISFFDFDLFYCRRRLEKTWTIKESILLQEEFRKNLNHQRIKSIAVRVQKKLESSKNQVYCSKSSEKTWIIKELILLQEFRKPRQSSEEKKKKKKKKQGKKKKKKKMMMMMKECKSRETWKRREDDSFQYDNHPSMLLQMAGRREEKTTKGWLFSLWQSSVHPSRHLQMAWWRRREE